MSRVVLAPQIESSTPSDCQVGLLDADGRPRHLRNGNAVKLLPLEALARELLLIPPMAVSRHRHGLEVGQALVVSPMWICHWYKSFGCVTTTEKGFGSHFLLPTTRGTTPQAPWDTRRRSLSV